MKRRRNEGRRLGGVEVSMDALLAVMPFADVRGPSIGVSLLKAEIAACGFASRIEYFNLELAEIIGRDVYQHLANNFPSETLVGEWFFADALFGDSLPDERDYVVKFLTADAREGDTTGKILQSRACRHRFIESCALRINRYRPRVVGFTTTFHQTCASLAVARRLKELPDPPVIVFGGANCEGEMGLQIVQSFPWVDYACLGEGDRAFPELLQALRDKSSVRVPGIAKKGDSAPTSPERVKDLDSLPIPDYADYFERLSSSPLRPELEVDLMIETSRGCWWGAKQHCTFCGLNGDTMAFRSKSPERVFSELAFLSETYRLKSIECVDNILNMKYVPALFERLRDSGLNLELFYEVKANLRHEQLAVLRAGGVRALQPGIESFSNQVLRLMRKGCTGLQNIQLLRWCEEMDVQVGWNLLAGFPGESPSEYDRMEELVPLLTHLQAPAACSPVRLDRFSPFFAHADEFGLVRVRPAPAYYYVFPLGRRDLAKLAYFFDFDYSDGRCPFEYIMGLAREVRHWTQAKAAGREHGPRLDAICAEGRVTITDTRSVATSARHELSGLAAELYLQCDSVQTLTGLRRALCYAADGEISRALADLIDAKLMIADDDHYLSLAVFRNRARRERIEQHHVYTAIPQTEDSYALRHLV